MVIDTSAIVAVLLKEPGFERFIDCIASDPVRLISAVNSLESAIVIEARKGDQGGRELDLLLHKAKIDIVPFTPELADEARSAWRRYGKQSSRGSEFLRLLRLRAFEGFGGGAPVPGG